MLLYIKQEMAWENILIICWLLVYTWTSVREMVIDLVKEAIGRKLSSRKLLVVTMAYFKQVDLCLSVTYWKQVLRIEERTFMCGV